MNTPEYQEWLDEWPDEWLDECLADENKEIEDQIMAEEELD